MRNRPNVLGGSAQQPPARAVVFFWIIAFGVTATAGFTIMAMFYALSGRDPRALGLLALFAGFAVSLVVAIAPAFVKLQPAPRPVPAPASARRTAFVSLSSLWLALYVVAISNLHGLLDITVWPLWAGVAAALGATLSAGALVYALLRYILRETDEYQRSLMMRAALIAGALTFFLLTAWGLFELYAGAPHFSVAMTLAPFCFCFAIANWWVRGRT